MSGSCPIPVTTGAGDAVIARAVGSRAGEVLHLRQASDRGLGVSDPDKVRTVGAHEAVLLLDVREQPHQRDLLDLQDVAYEQRIELVTLSEKQL